jgi:putative Mn2+ efflux pump MntP
MDLFIIIIVAIGLSIDTFAVSISSGIAYQEISFFNACKIALTLAFFQTMMPFAGWGLGEQLRVYIASFDHWIAFGLLSVLGLKMMVSSLKKHEDKKFNPLHPLTLFTISIATSIDALAVGFTFAIVQIPILYAGFIIGSVTYIASMLGILIGKKLKSKNSALVEIIGGLILIGIGIKILIEHLS